MRPLVLRADNFTPPSRTPWGGTRILSRLKHALPLAPEKAAYPVVGESWEVSVEPDFPSVADDGTALSAWIARDPVATLGREARDGRTGTALLVKLLDADDALSVQIHPADDDPGLREGESGKPESWYVVAREPGAGVYLGLAPGVTQSQMAAALDANGDVSTLLTFVPVEVGDFLVIDAGTAHAIGPGLTLVEPQRVVPGRRGLTYRYWDWNRRYDRDGRVDAQGAPRALHAREALAVTRWNAPRGDAFLALARHRAGPADIASPATITDLCGRGGPLPNEHLQVSRLAGTGPIPWPRWDALVALTVLDGAVTLDGTRIAAGQSAAVPACWTGEARCECAHAVLSAAY